MAEFTMKEGATVLRQNDPYFQKVLGLLQSNYLIPPQFCEQKGQVPLKH